MKPRILVLLVSLSFGATAAERGDAGDQYNAILSKLYPGYEVAGPFLDPHDDNRSYRRSPQNFVGDILVGDFNFDGLDDFAAGLIEKGGVAKAEDGGKPEGLTVVCSSIINNEYQCTTLVTLRPFGFHVYLDLVDWTPWMDILRHPENKECPIQLETHINQKFLTIVEPYGHCDTLYYQGTDGTYLGCEYCAD